MKEKNFGAQWVSNYLTKPVPNFKENISPYLRNPLSNLALKTDSCRLCGLIQNILIGVNEEGFKEEPWNQELSVVNFDGSCETLELKGLIVNTPKGYREVVRYLDNDCLFVNILPQKNYADDVMIGMPLEHVCGYSSSPRESGNLMRVAIELIKEQYKGHGRILFNIGERFASVPDHIHCQVIQTKETELFLPPIRRKY